MKKRILLFGTFDDVHPGHHFLFEEALKRAHETEDAELWVVIARDTTVHRIKGHMPVQPEGERMKAIQDAYPDAHIVLGDAQDFRRPLHDICPDLVLLGYDQALPPGVVIEDFPCLVQRLPPFHPDKYKSSLRRQL
jgi:FAD synthetase